VCCAVLCCAARRWPLAAAPLAAATMARGLGVRLKMYSLVSGHAMVNHSIRSALPSLIPLCSDALRYTEAQQALLLSAFFPGYILTQLPGGWASQRWGGKPVAALNLYCNALLFLLGPLAARAYERPLDAHRGHRATGWLRCG
jgi:MFS family permease